MITDSMAPTLRGTTYADGDRILIEKITGRIRSPQRWEIISFYQSDGTLVMKRIVGLPGEEVVLKENRIFIDSREIARPRQLEALRYLGYGNLSNGRAVACGNGYYVLGDDSRDSYDSRFEGPVPAEAVRGRAWLILWPFSRMGFVR